MTISNSRLTYEPPRLEVHYLPDEPSVLAVSAKCRHSKNHSKSKGRPSKEKCSDS